MNNSLIGLKRVSNTLPTDGQVPVYNASLGEYSPGNAGAGASARIFNEQILSAGDITAGFRELNPVPGWVLESADGGYLGRAQFGDVVKHDDGYYYIIGGYDTSFGYATTIAKSLDGKLWSTFTPTNMPARRKHGTASFSGKLWIICGDSSGGSSNAVYSSSDNGITWALEGTIGTTGRRELSVWVYDSKLWVAGGLVTANDVWNSTDGATWTEVTASAAWSARLRTAHCVHDGKMWIAGGDNNSGTYYTDIYNSTDGATWTIQANDLLPRSNAVLASWNEKLWYNGGVNNSGRYNTSQWSDDGIDWNDEANGTWAARHGHGVIGSETDMILVGGLPQVGVSQDVYTREPFTTLALTAGKVLCSLLTGVILAADNIWIRTTSKLVYAYDAVIREWGLLTEYTTLFEVESEPGSGMVDGDVWIKTSNQNLYVYETSAWVLEYSAITSYLQETRPVERSIVPLRNQARAAVSVLCDFVADGSKLYFDNTDGHTYLSGKPIEGDILIVEVLP